MGNVQSKKNEMVCILLCKQYVKDIANAESKTKANNEYSANHPNVHNFVVQNNIEKCMKHFAENDVSFEEISELRDKSDIDASVRKFAESIGINQSKFQNQLMEGVKALKQNSPAKPKSNEIDDKLSRFIKEHRLDLCKGCFEKHLVTYGDLMKLSRADNVEAEVRQFAKDMDITKKIYQDRLIEGVKALRKGYVTKIYIWRYKGSREAWGHSSMQLSDGTYLSWWPSKRVGAFNASAVVEAAPAPTYADDKYDEDGDAHYVYLANLCEDQVKEWWNEFKDSNGYKATGKKSHNCASLVKKALKIGGIDIGKESNFIAFTPEHLKAMMDEVKSGKICRIKPN